LVTDKCCLRHAKQLECGRVRALHEALDIDQDNTLGERIEEASVMHLALADLLCPRTHLGLQLLLAALRGARASVDHRKERRVREDDADQRDDAELLMERFFV
jgi:hypothetical protein